MNRYWELGCEWFALMSRTRILIKYQMLRLLCLLSVFVLQSCLLTIVFVTHLLSKRLHMYTFPLVFILSRICTEEQKEILLYTRRKSLKRPLKVIRNKGIEGGVGSRIIYKDRCHLALQVSWIRNVEDAYKNVGYMFYFL